MDAVAGTAGRFIVRVSTSDMVLEMLVIAIIRLGFEFRFRPRIFDCVSRGKLYPNHSILVLKIDCEIESIAIASFFFLLSYFVKTFS